MTDVEIKELVEQTVSIYTNQVAEINQCKADCENKIAELNKTIETITNEKNEAIASSAEIRKALDDLKAEQEEWNKKWNELWEEKQALERALGEAKARERIGELNSAIAEFTDEEKAYAKTEIDAFMAAPVESEINSVVDKIMIGIGKKAREDAAAAMVAEQNAANPTSFEDIFEGIEAIPASSSEDTNIF